MEKTPKKRYWKSLDEFVDQEKFEKLAEKEFMNSPLQEEDKGVGRRDFLKLMGASLALSSTACIRRPAQKVVPYVNRPEDWRPGEASYYASSVYDNGEAYGVILKTLDGRPIKMEGLPEFPLNRGALSARMQAHVVSLYDPDRLKKPRIRIEEKKDFHKRIWNDVDWEKMDDALTKVIKNGKLGMLTSSQPSPSKKSILQDFNSTFGVKHYVYDSTPREELRDAQEFSYGDKIYPRYRLDKAKYILSVGADFLGTYGDVVSQAKDFSKSRKPTKDMSRLVVFESLMSLTGSNSDFRIRIPSSQYKDVVMGLAHEIVVSMGKSSYAGNSVVKASLSPFSGIAARLGIEPELFQEIAKNLWENRGQSLVISGGLSAKTDSALELQIATNFLNTVLENDGKSVDYKNIASQFEGSGDRLQALVDDINGGKIDTLIVQGVNPVYVAPRSLKVRDALKKVTLIYSSTYMDETAQIADYVLAENHSLEDWGDWEFMEGLYSIQQPVIRPLHSTRSFEFNLMTWAYFINKGPERLKDFESWYDYVRWNWQNRIARGQTAGKSFDTFWVDLLQKGFIDTKASNRDRNFSSRNFRTSSLSRVSSANTKNDGLELNLYQKIGIGDGHLANLPWMQEFPDPVTKVTWDNYLTISYKTAKENDLEDGDVVKLNVGNFEMEVPVFIQVGQDDSSLGLAVGYGREFGEIAKFVGVKAFDFSKWKNNRLISAGIPASFKKTGKKHELANTQGHHYMEGRDIVVETTLKNYLKEPSSGIHKHKTFSIWPKFKYPGHKWGMSINQNTCIGCSACVIACQAENNIPVVGKKYVLEGREMHWMRIDRYYSGSSLNGDIPENPDVFFQPQLCQHCDNAPCESVCPVLATTHSPEGINEMTYNRCVGTRYCSNNCPYKARRFNWFAYTNGDRDLDTPKDAYNPNVTVRSRGVMEKCTFCIQRIKEAKEEIRGTEKSLQDGDIVTACEQTCPTNAIVFGDMNDPESRVSKLHQEKNSYKLLEATHAEPAVRYLTKIRNKDSVSTGHHGGEH